MNTWLLYGPHCLDNPRRAAVCSGRFVARNHRLRRLLTFSTGRPEIIETSNKSNDYYRISYIYVHGRCAKRLCTYIHTYTRDIVLYSIVAAQRSCMRFASVQCSVYTENAQQLMCYFIIIFTGCCNGFWLRTPR